ncbi:MAG: hypothetical protein K6G16_05190 [Lachnospiraceae bacterium]|nr:hypothetical protein [Lachnospiraceae bacterium]
MSKDTAKTKPKKELTEKQVERRNAVKQALKDILVPLAFIGVVALAIFLIIFFQKTDNDASISEIHEYTGDETEIILENDALKLTMDPVTTQFSLLVKQTGKVWYSNAQDTEKDSIALGAEKDRLNSTIALTYSDASGVDTAINSYAHSTKNKNYEIESDASSITVRYSIGDIEKDYIIPAVMTKEVYDRFVGAMSASEKELVSQYYKKYDIDNLSKKDDKDALLARYPIMSKEVIYAFRSETKETQRKKLEGYFGAAGFTYDDYLESKSLDNAEKTSDKPVFNVTIRYRLEGDELVVEVPLSEIEHRKDYPLYSLSPLPYFGATGTDAEGFLFVPEGSGALIRFNNNKTSLNGYYANLYGWDYGISRKDLVHDTRVFYNTFGLSEGDDSFLCILEGGRAYAAVRADVAGKTNSYNYIDATYTMLAREQYDVTGLSQGEVYSYLWELPDETVSQRYRFIASGDYTDMAKSYASYLKDTYGEVMSLRDDTDAPVAIEIVGAIDKVKQILGVPVSRPLPLTTYAEAGTIISDLSEGGLKNLSVRLTGWCNGGLKQKILKHIRPIRSLGGAGGLKKLIAGAGSANATLYLDGATMYEYDSNIFNGFFSFRDAARFITKERAEQHQFSHITYASREFAESYYLLHADLADRMADNLQTYAVKNGAGVSFADIGKDLAADYYRKNMRSRQVALEDQMQRFKALQENRTPFLTQMGNEYAALYSDIVMGMDLKGSEYTILDAYIPFYELAIHGYVDYTGDPINLCGNAEEELLLCARYGAGLSYAFMKADAFVTQKTMYSELYGASYDSWRERAIATYNRYNKEMGHVFRMEMTDYDNLSDEVSVTVYEDGTKVYVNTGFNDYDAEGVLVPARDYVVVR